MTSLTVILDQEKLEDWFSTCVEGHILHPFLHSSVNMTTLLECFLHRYFGPIAHIHQFGLLNISIFSLNYANSLDDESRLIYSILTVFVMLYVFVTVRLLFFSRYFCLNFVLQCIAVDDTMINETAFKGLTLFCTQNCNFSNKNLITGNVKIC